MNMSILTKGHRKCRSAHEPVLDISPFSRASNGAGSALSTCLTRAGAPWRSNETQGRIKNYGKERRSLSPAVADPSTFSYAGQRLAGPRKLSGLENTNEQTGRGSAPSKVQPQLLKPYELTTTYHTRSPHLTPYIGVRRSHQVVIIHRQEQSDTD